MKIFDRLDLGEEKMAIGIICEYNPFHNGHIYHIKEIRKKYPLDTLILCLNGYFLERGEISILTKEEKTNIALLYGVDIVVELPTLYGCQSADIFASNSIQILHSLHVSKIIFGSESCNIEYLTKLAQKQLNNEFTLIQNHESYPKRLALSLEETNIIPPNDILAISYIKAILKNNYPIKVECILRTSEYHDTTSNDSIISAKNIREKLKRNENIKKFVPKEVLPYLKLPNETLLFQILKVKIISEKHLEKFLDVTEGLEFKLKKCIREVNSLEELIASLKSKRYTYNRIQRMLIHIYLGIEKEDTKIPLDFIHVLGFSETGKNYLNQHKKTFLLPFTSKQSKIKEIELNASLLYDVIMNTHTYEFEKKNKPLIIKRF